MIRTSGRSSALCVARKLPNAVEERLAKTYRGRFNAEDKQLTGDELLAARPVATRF